MEILPAFNRFARRSFLTNTASGLGLIALQSLAGPLSGKVGFAKELQGSLGQPHFPPKAKRVIYLFQSGGPSQVDLFDYKPTLEKEHGQEMPASVLGTQRVSLMTRDKGRLACKSLFKMEQNHSSGAWVSELLPAINSVSDELCFIKSLQTEPINHDPAVMFMQTGRAITGRPAIGSWLHYGLGSENQNLPAYVVMISGLTDQPVLSRFYHSGFLPSRYQGVQFQSTGDPVLFLSNPPGIPSDNRRRIIDTANELNRVRLEETGDSEIEARIDAYEMAFRMQTSVPALMNLSDEPQHILDMYGPDVTKPGTYANQCLIARKLAEQDVRFVQIFHAGWDHHSNLRDGLVRQTKSCDRGSAALIRDLKMRGLLDDTLVIWGGEFGRASYAQGEKFDGRDHHPRCFTVWMAGGGIRPGISVGSTDDFGYNVAENPIQVRDLHATILKLLGIDHERFTFKNQGLDDRLTGVEPARLLTEIMV